MKQILIVSKNTFLTQMMQAAGVFENFKVVVMPVAVVEIEEDKIEKVVVNFTVKKDNDPYQVIALLEGKNVLYRDETVKSVSNGTNWCPFDDYLKLLLEM